jgi:hypothetical protein
MNTSEFVIAPTSQDLAGIRGWLEEEELKEGHSFICNWRTIEYSFNNSRAFCFRINGKPIGFVVWENKISSKVVELLIAAVKPEMRRQGHGGVLASRTLDLFQRRGIMVVLVECMPPQSEGFWRLHDFVDFPSEYYTHERRRSIKLFRSLADGAQSRSPSFQSVRMQLWHKSIHDVQDHDAAGTEIQLNINDNGRFVSSLAIPAMPDWKVCLSFEDGTKKAGKVKYVLSRDCFEDGFIVGVPQLAEHQGVADGSGNGF